MYKCFISGKNYVYEIVLVSEPLNVFDSVHAWESLNSEWQNGFPRMKAKRRGFVWLSHLKQTHTQTIDIFYFR